MSFDLAPWTELDAVNELLDAIGESSISTFNEMFADAAQARKTLHRTSRRIQTRGWSFNTDTDYELAVSIDGKVPVPSNVLSIDFPENSAFMLREGYVYDNENRTYVIGSSVSADIVWFQDFKKLPMPAQDYIVLTAALKFQSDTNADDTNYAYDSEDLRRFKEEFLRSEIRTLNLNVLNTQTMRRITTR